MPIIWVTDENWDIILQAKFKQLYYAVTLFLQLFAHLII